MLFQCTTRSNSKLPFFSLLIFFFFFFLFSFSNGLHNPKASSFLEVVNGYERNGPYDDGLMVKWENSNSRRFLAENPPEGNSSLMLAAQRTYRRDPLENFKRYTGGWNISNKHYWASVAFTAVPFFVVAAVWFVFFGLTLICTCLYFCCCRRAPYGYSRLCYALSLIFLILFTIAAIIGCIVLYTGQGKFHASTTTTLRYVVSQANFTVDNLNNVSQYLSQAKNIGVEQQRLPENLQNKINDVQVKIDSAATTLTEKTQDNSRKIRRGLDTVRLILIVLAAVMLFIAFIGFLLSIFGIQCCVYTLVIFGWVMVTATFILCGVFLLLHNVVADTCVAMDQWVQNPTAHTALDDILPCVDEATAQETLQRSKEATSQLVSLMNLVIGNVVNAAPDPNAVPPVNYNQSGPPLPTVCNPFNADLTNRTCAQGEVNFDNATEVWRNFVCQARTVQRSEVCITTGRLTPQLYDQLSSAINVSYGLYHYAPFLVDLQDCTFVRQTFSDISNQYCPGLRKYTQWIYIGLLLVSAAVMFSLIFWVIYARERRHRVYTKQFMAGEGY